MGSIGFAQAESVPNKAAVHQALPKPRHLGILKFLWRHTHTSNYIFFYLYVCEIEPNFKGKYNSSNYGDAFSGSSESHVGGSKISTQPFPLLKSEQPVNQQGGALPRSAKAVT